MRRLALAALLLAVAVGGVTLGYLIVRDDAPAPVVVTPPALVAIDPETNRVVAAIAVGSRPVTVAAGEGAVWVGDARDGTISRVDPDARRVEKTIGVGAPVVDLAVGEGSVWAATGGFGEVVRVDPELGAIADRVAMGDPGDPIVPTVAAIGAGEGRVWAGVFEQLARLDPSSGEVLATFDLSGRENVLQLAVGGGAVWATTIASRAKRIEASSGRETAEFYAGEWVYPVALGGGGLWVGGGAGLSRVDPATGATVWASRPVVAVSGVAYGEDSVWIASDGGPTVVRVSPATGVPEARISIGAGRGRDVAVHEGLVWVVVASAE